MPLPLGLNRDRLTSVPVPAVAQTAMRVLDAIQSDHKEAQIAGMACAFILLANHLQVHSGTALEIASRILTDKKRKTDLRAVEMYIQNELK